MAICRDETGADRRQLRRHVRLPDRHLDDDELYRERGRRLRRRPHRTDGLVRRDLLPGGFVVRAARWHDPGLCVGRGIALRRLHHGARAGRDRLGRHHGVGAGVVAAVSMPLTYSIATGIGLGFITYALAKLIAGNFADLKPACGAGIDFVIQSGSGRADIEERSRRRMPAHCRHGNRPCCRVFAALTVIFAKLASKSVNSESRDLHPHHRGGLHLGVDSFRHAAIPEPRGKFRPHLLFLCCFALVLRGCAISAR